MSQEPSLRQLGRFVRRALTTYSLYIFGLDRGLEIGDMAKRQQPWWWRSEALGQVAVTLFAAVAAYLARLLMLYFP
jgi:hypothetical protein